MARTACPECGTRYDVPDSAFGKTTTCKQCDQRFLVRPLPPTTAKPAPQTPDSILFATTPVYVPPPAPPVVPPPSEPFVVRHETAGPAAVNDRDKMPLWVKRLLLWPAFLGILFCCGLPSIVLTSMSSPLHKQSDDSTAVVNRAAQMPATIAPRQVTQAELTGTRFGPYRTKTGIDTEMIYVDWKNTGNTPVRGVFVTFKVYDANRNYLGSTVGEICVYSAFDSQPGVPPGYVYTQPYGEGKIIDLFKVNYPEAKYFAPELDRVVSSGP